MDNFKLTLLLQALKNLSVVSRLDNIKNLTILGDYIKRDKVKDNEVLSVYINASHILLGGKKYG